jgi:hypothetical protein
MSALNRHCEPFGHRLHPTARLSPPDGEAIHPFAHNPHSPPIVIANRPATDRTLHPDSPLRTVKQSPALGAHSYRIRTRNREIRTEKPQIRTRTPRIRTENREIRT